MNRWDGGFDGWRESKGSNEEQKGIGGAGTVGTKERWVREKWTRPED